jgi:nitroreductase
MVKVKVFDSTEARASARRPAEAPPTDAAAFHAVVESRRSVRIFTDDPVPEDVVTRCLDAALLAPNSSNLQTWQIHWVRSPEKKAALVEACLSQPTAVTAQELFVFVARPDLWRENNARMLDRLNADPKVPERGKQYYKVITKIAYNQGPLGLLKPFKWLWFNIRGLSKPTPREPIGLADMDVWAHKSTALAAGTFMLALRAEGFDSCPMEGLDSVRVKRILGLPRAAGICMAVSAGRRAEGGIYGPRYRFPRETAVFEH